MTPMSRILGRQSHLNIDQQGSFWSRSNARLTHEQVIGIRHIATNPKELHQVMELAVDVTTYLHNPHISFGGTEPLVHPFIPSREHSRSSHFPPQSAIPEP